MAASWDGSEAGSPCRPAAASAEPSRSHEGRRRSDRQTGSARATSSWAGSSGAATGERRSLGDRLKGAASSAGFRLACDLSEGRLESAAARSLALGRWGGGRKKKRERAAAGEWPKAGATNQRRQRCRAPARPRSAERPVAWGPGGRAAVLLGAGEAGQPWAGLGRARVRAELVVAANRDASSSSSSSSSEASESPRDGVAARLRRRQRPARRPRPSRPGRRRASPSRPVRPRGGLAGSSAMAANYIEPSASFVDAAGGGRARATNVDEGRPAGRRAQRMEEEEWRGPAGLGDALV